MSINETANTINIEDRSQNKKTNKTFLLLSVFGILFVVMGHCEGTPYAFLSNVFPFYSFHMALFAFISGYFFKERKFTDFIKTKIKKLIIPFFIWNIIYGIIINLLRYFNVIKYGNDFTLYNIFIAPFYGSGNQFYFNLAAWFVLAIFFVQFIYIIINKIMNKLKINTEIPVLIISTIIAIFELKMVKQGYNYGIWYLITRICFLMPFYAIGQVYKKIEEYDKIKNIVYFSIIILLQCILKQKFDLMYNLNILSFKHNFLVYLVGSMTGILFWLRVSKIVSKYIGDNRIINYIGNNTYSVMMHHIFVFFLLNSLICIANKLFGIFKSFDMNSFQTRLWYGFGKNNSAIALVYVILAITIPILVKNICLNLKEKIKLKRGRV